MSRVLCVVYIARVTIHMHMAEQRLSKLRGVQHTHTYAQGAKRGFEKEREEKRTNEKLM